VVEYDGSPVETFFFASSGGQTESVQNVFQIAPEAWLVSRPDPYDGVLNNPYHHWKMSFSLKAARAKLGHLVDGALKGIKVLQRGVSPRIVKAQVVGTKGSVTVSGTLLRKALGTPSTWVKFTTVSAHGVETSTTPAATITTPSATGTETTPTSTTGGGALVRLERVALALGHIGRALGLLGLAGIHTTHYAVNGTVFPLVPGAGVTVQYNPGAGWSTIATGSVKADGRYSIHVADPGSYRVIYDGTVGPEITVG
jgi:stage II sporulation protein D